MSDDYILFVPTSPRFVPDAAGAERGALLLRQRVPQADGISIESCDGIRLFDAGSNLESVHCPTCRSSVDLEGWYDCLDRDFDGSSFRLAEYPVPCCRALHSLDRLVYRWPQAFGRFALVAMNAGIARVDGELKAEIEAALGTAVVVIYRHL